jgi:hypothetical protein
MSVHKLRTDASSDLEPSLNRANSLARLAELAMGAGEQAAAEVAIYELVEEIGCLHREYHVARKKIASAPREVNAVGGEAAS